MRAYAAGAVIIAGCTGDSHCVVDNPEHDSESGNCVAVSVSAGDSGGFDTIEVFVSQTNIEFVRPVLTPALIASGRSAPTSFHLLRRTGEFMPRVLPEVVQHYAYNVWGDIDDWIPTMAVVAHRGGALVGASVATLPFRVNDIDWLYLDGSVTLSPSLEVEIWAQEKHPSSVPMRYKHDCVRIVGNDGLTTYAVRYNDRDCDGVDDANDCTPERYCDPNDGPCACPP
jgi:hypothetical protein